MSIFHKPYHLPKRRQDGDGPQRLPRQRRGTTPQMHGRYPDYDVLSEASHWDEATRSVVLDRVANPPRYTFFEPEERATLEAFCDTVTAQDAEPRIQVLRYIDQRLAQGKLDGYQHVELPDDRELWHQAAQVLDREGFAALDAQGREAVCEALSKGELEWEGIDSSKAWSVLMRYVLAAFYAHPWAWNEIGFGGPAYPRGYSRFGEGTREEWEGEEWQGEGDPALE
jgi:hypothetical protein